MVPYNRNISQLINAMVYTTRTTACLVMRQGYSKATYLLSGYSCKVWGRLVWGRRV